MPKALHDCCGLRECSTSSGAGVMRRRRCVRNGEALEASVVKSQPNSANGRGETRDIHLVSQELACEGLKSAWRTDACQARSSLVLVFRMIHGRRRAGGRARRRGGRQLLHWRPHTRKGTRRRRQRGSWACSEAVERMNACRKFKVPTQGYSVM